MDFVHDSDEEDHEQGEVGNMCNAENDITLNTTAEDQDAGYTDEDDGAIVTHCSCRFTSVTVTEQLWRKYGYYCRVFIVVRLGGAKIFVQVYIERDGGGRRHRGHCVHGGWAELDRKRRGIGGVSFIYECACVRCKGVG